MQYPNGAGTAATYEYDDMYRPESVSAFAGSQELFANYTYTDDLLTGIETGSTAYTFTYGVFGLRSSVKAGTRTLASYEYTQDRNYDLAKLNYGNGYFVSYTYDA